VTFETQILDTKFVSFLDVECYNLTALKVDRCDRSVVMWRAVVGRWAGGALGAWSLVSGGRDVRVSTVAVVYLLMENYLCIGDVYGIFHWILTCALGVSVFRWV